VVLDKNPHIRTVVNKLNRIENPFRVLDMEIIAGES
jgi:tRNA (guanine37-N1)-methyltransferase